MKILIINGPNINLTGLREPEIYGKKSFSELESYILESCDIAGVEGVLFQSNCEGAIIDRIQQAYGECNGIVINAAGYTHTSIAIMDALIAVGLPAIEVHMSDITSRESFRLISFTGKACIKSFMGKGFESYRDAILYISQYLIENKSNKKENNNE